MNCIHCDSPYHRYCPPPKEKAGDEARRVKAERERARRITGGPAAPYECTPSKPTAEWRERYGTW